VNISSITSGAVVTASGGGTRTIGQPVSTTSGGTGAGVSTQAPSSGQVAQAVRQVNDAFVQKGKNLYASIEKDKISGMDVVQIVDSTTHEVVTQYPSKAIVAMADAMAQPKGGSGQLMNVSA
jgi:uncharacterized FlaG/YvyC family protein